MIPGSEAATAPELVAGLGVLSEGAGTAWDPVALALLSLPKCQYLRTEWPTTDGDVVSS